MTPSSNKDFLFFVLYKMCTIAAAAAAANANAAAVAGGLQAQHTSHTKRSATPNEQPSWGFGVREKRAATCKFTTYEIEGLQH
jgi:hypothetical protein